MEARQGRDAAGGSMRHAHDSATGHLPGAGDAQWQLMGLASTDMAAERANVESSTR